MTALNGNNSPIDPAAELERVKQELAAAPPAPRLPLKSLQDVLNEDRPKAKARYSKPIREYRPFPIDALPEPFSEFVRQGAEALSCDPAYIALPGIAGLGSAIGNKRWGWLSRKWRVPYVFWTATVGDSGTRKSPAFELALERLNELDYSAKLVYDRDLETYLSREEEYRIQRRMAIVAGGPQPEEPKPPVCRRYLCDDITPETVADLLADRPEGILVACDELSGWFAGFCRYSKGGVSSSAMPTWLKMHQASSWRYDRKKGPDAKAGQRRSISIRRAHVCICGGIQHFTLINCLTREARQAGLAARLLVAMPPKRKRNPKPPEIDPEIDKAYQRTIDWLLALDFDTREGQLSPFYIRLGPEAQDIWDAFLAEWAERQEAAFGEEASILSKLEGYAARFMFLHHSVVHAFRQVDDKVPVRPESALAGITLCKWFEYEMLRVYRTLDESSSDRDARRLREYIRTRGGRINIYKMRHSLRYASTIDLEADLQPLVDAGWARIVEEPPPNGGRAAKFVQLIDPPILDFEAVDVEESDDPRFVADESPDGLAELWLARTTRMRDGKPWENRVDVMAGLTNLLERGFTPARIRQEILRPERDSYEWFSVFQDRLKAGKAPAPPVAIVDPEEARLERIRRQREEAKRAAEESLTPEEIRAMLERARPGQDANSADEEPK